MPALHSLRGDAGHNPQGIEQLGLDGLYDLFPAGDGVARHLRGLSTWNTVNDLIALLEKQIECVRNETRMQELRHRVFSKVARADLCS